MLHRYPIMAVDHLKNVVFKIVYFKIQEQYRFCILSLDRADVAELVDARDLGSRIRAV